MDEQQTPAPDAGGFAEDLGRTLVGDLLVAGLDIESIEVRYLTVGTYQLIVTERGEEARERILIS